MPASSRLRAVVVGTGWVAQRVHLPYISACPTIELAAVVDPNPARLRAAAGAADVAAASRIGGLRDDLEADVAVVCTPPDAHAGAIAECLARGWHVICEKPFVTSSHDARTLIAAAARRGLALRCCQTSRFRADVLTVAGEVSSGRLGEIRHIRSTWRRARGVPATGGGRRVGALWDLGAHLVDLIWAICDPGDPTSIVASGMRLSSPQPTRLTARWQGEPGEETGDRCLAGAAVHLGFARAIASVEVHWATGVAPDETEVLVLGSKGTALIRSVFGNSPDRLSACGPALTIGYLNGSSLVQHDHGTGADDYAAQNAKLFSTLEEGDTWPAAEDLVRVVGVLEAAHRDLVMYDDAAL